ncbi:MAG: hypothetical protein SP1CHLAM54_11180 [Chlamydiia bacterium]|nr:hypothetical protein [Chlamydiia bacterium]MCH9616021.1 hypothetical protein [Chlamydiia bacterium]MCH9629044.1 hypothetical protein [Chlamydiia bacterium]
MKRLFLVLSCALPLFAEIIEIKSFKEVEHYTKPETLLILDLDNTIYEPVQEYGNDQWFRRRKQEIGLEPTLLEWMAIQNITDVRTVEEKTSEYIKELQEKYTTMGLTTRGLGLCVTTLDQLRRLSVDLSKSAPTKEEVYVYNNRGVLFRGGVLFTAGSHKGKAFQKFMKAVGFKPKHVVFVNDKRDHLEQLLETLDEEKIPHTGLRYGGLDERVASYNHEVACLQKQQFKTLISDDEALKHLLEEKVTADARQ